MSPLLSVPGLKKLLSHTDTVRILDATALLPGESTNPKLGFQRGHIPTSAYFDIDVFSDPESSKPHTVPTPARFERLFGALGISNSDTVVFYDQGNSASSCRGWWLARLFGHENVYVLDGGLPEWLRQEGSVEQGDSVSATAVPYVSHPYYARLKGLGDMLACVQSGSNPIIDARSADRFYGRVPEPRPGLASGHMPGAVNIPFKRLLDPSRRFLSADAARQIFESHGITSTNPAITTCGSGMTASVLNVGLCLAGFPEGALYDGSWAEWGAQPNTPVTKED
ncbi:sulfurtransferase [Acetobacter cibinongensis]|uniref:Thiosulfate sulfurtransferase n=1 Tax=Acetobacter cibinongensis TaxID=146475 RepID=A0A1Z5YY86_9PROT|nr:sulfurtransferase [Acetobacter cibinongensis]OUJ04312.1 thiosulfate sulfurtransferase [Acetobacter cibinongensis]